MRPNWFSRSILFAAVAVFLPALFAPAGFSTPAGDSPSRFQAPQPIPGRVLVRVEEGLSEEAVRGIALSVDAELDRRLTDWGLYLFRFSEERPVEAVIEALGRHPRVRYAEPDARMELYGSGSGAGAGLSEAGAEVIVAVIDTGVDLAHTAFTDRLWTNAGEIAGDGIDNDGNGLIDDVHGADFWDRDGDPTGGTGIGAHGTQVAGRVVQGAVDARVRIMPLRVGPGPYLSLSAIIQAVDYAVAHGARIINMSFGSSAQSVSLAEALERAANAGVMLVAAAGNSATSAPSYPAALEGVVSVAATYNNGRRAWFSNFGETVDFSAPGYQVETATFGGGTASVSGTSFSAPFVAGVAARVLAAHPGLNPVEVAARLVAFAKDPDAPNFSFFHGKMGDGFIDPDVAQAIADALPLPESGEDPGEGETPVKPEPDLEEQLRAQLAAAEAEVERLEGELAAAESELEQAENQVAQAQQESAAALEAVREKWSDFFSAWRRWFRALIFRQGTPQQRQQLRAEMDRTRDELFEAFADYREASQRLRVAQAQAKQAEDNRNRTAEALEAARRRADEIRRRLDDLLAGASAAGIQQQRGLQAQMQALRRVHEALEASPVPPGVNARSVPDLLALPDDRLSE